ncbi:MAG: DUF1926 domain-containing protein [Spirochaetaceae bacterium]|nr:DUF1926 domain-containing protein [Spirochaetaceae bacterium]
MKKVKLIFGTHNSISPSTDDKEIEDIYQKAYKPFLTTLYNFPEISAVLYYSGPLLEWFEKNHPEFNTVLNEMVDKKQVELLGGGFYEPVLSLIPAQDRIGQIEMMTTYLRKSFGKRARGCWLPGRIWEPSLASVLRSSGIDYTFLDDTHFEAAGYTGNDLFKPIITEDQGKTVTVFPISRNIMSGFGKIVPRKIIEDICNDRSSDNKIVVIFPNGRQIGYENGYSFSINHQWLESFLNELKNNKKNIELVHPGRFVRQTKNSINKGYFPCTSYGEIMKWVLPSEKQKEFDKITANLTEMGIESKWIYGGFFRQFLSKYRESNFLYSKMMHVSILTSQVRGDKYKKKAAKDELWKGQSNLAYWHGNQGGLYNPGIRHNAYKALIDSEKITREKGIFKTSLSAIDYDMDGEKEFLYQGHVTNAYVHRKGAVLFEYDHISSCWNYLNTLARYPEPYHNDEITQAGYDSYGRHAFIDHFIDKNESVVNFSNMTYTEQGSFIDDYYESVDYDREHRKVTFIAIGTVVKDGYEYNIEIQKKYTFKRSSIDVDYQIKNLSLHKAELCFGSEVNLSFKNDDDNKAKIFHIKDEFKDEIPSDKVEHEMVEQLLTYDQFNQTDVSLLLSKPAEMWTFPVYTYSRGSGRIEKNYQSSCYVPRWTFKLLKDEIWNVSLTLRIDRSSLS